jgi:REP element-mobilizing transposase RayT
MSNLDPKSYYKRNLPHLHPAKRTFFITCRLHGAIPRSLYREWEEIKNQDLELPEEESPKRKAWFKKMDACLDGGGFGPTWLADERVAQMVFNSLSYRNGKVWVLICFCIMPNHLHMVFEHLDDPEMKEDLGRGSLSGIMHSFKLWTAREGNKILGRSGQFWDHESYDHVVRSGKALDRIVGYVINNPVKADLVRHWKDWPWTWTTFEP